MAQVIPAAAPQVFLALAPTDKVSGVVGRFATKNLHHTNLMHLYVKTGMSSKPVGQRNSERYAAASPYACFSLPLRCVKQPVNISVPEAARDGHGEKMFTAAQKHGFFWGGVVMFFGGGSERSTDSCISSLNAFSSDCGQHTSQQPGAPVVSGPAGQTCFCCST